MPLFRQSETKGLNPVWSPVAMVISELSKTHPTPGQKACQAPKPILLNVGAAQLPYPYVPSVVEVSLLRIGNLVSF
jgi:neutral ceramidase